MKNERRRAVDERRLTEVGRTVVEWRKPAGDPWSVKGLRDTSRGKKLQGAGAHARMFRLQDGARKEIEDKYGSFEEWMTADERRSKARERKETERLKAWLKKKLCR